MTLSLKLTDMQHKKSTIHSIREPLGYNSRTRVLKQWCKTFSSVRTVYKKSARKPWWL